MGKILIAGSLNMDIVFEMERMPKPGETVMGRSLRYSPGGKGANQACAAGKLGADAAMLGYVGADANGDALLKSLEAAGVDISLMGISAYKPTGTAAIFVDDSGMNSIAVIPGANLECGEAYLKHCDSMFRQCDFILLQMEIPASAVWYAVRRGRELGKTVILNPAPAPNSVPKGIFEMLD